MRWLPSPGSLLRPGHRPFAPRLRVFSRPALRLQHHASCDLKHITWKDSNFIRQISMSEFNESGSLASDSYMSPSTWAPLIHEWRKPNKKGKVSGEMPTDLSSMSDLSEIIERSHRLRVRLWATHANMQVDPIASLGIKRDRWDIADALLNSLIDSIEMLIPYTTPRGLDQGFDWGGKRATLTALTSPKLDEVDGSGIRTWGHGVYNPVKPLPSHQSLTLDSLSARPAGQYVSDDLLAQTLLSLGCIVMVAADQPQSESRLAMSYVYRALARLHHLDLLSEKLYQDPSNGFYQEGLRPPWLHMLSGPIMSVLSDAAWLEHQAVLAREATRAGEDPPFVSFNVGVRELGPEIWLEYILWCCVEHGFVRQGASLFHQIARRNWKFESWAPLMQDLDVVRQTNISREQSWRRPGNKSPPKTFKDFGEKPAFNGLGARTISSDVVSGLRGALPNLSYNGLGFYGLTADEMVKLQKSLSKALEPQSGNTDLRLTNRDSTLNIFRIINSGCLDASTDPEGLKQVISSTQNHIPPWQINMPLIPPDLETMTKSQLSNETSAMLGLAEYNTRAFSVLSNASSALLEYSRLQNTLDAAKAQHIISFFTKLDRAPSEEIPFFDSKHLDLSIPESSLPGVSRATLAKLLDLATECGHFKFGESLLFDSTIENPPIPPSAYSDQILIPSLLRFAAATDDKDLGNTVLTSVELPVSVNTLKAMLNYYIHTGEWDRALMITEYTRDYRLKAWGYSNIMTLAAKIFRLNREIEKRAGSARKRQKTENNILSLSHAKDLLRRFFKGDFNSRPIPISKQARMRSFQQDALQNLREFFLLFPGPVHEVMDDLKTPQSTKKPLFLSKIPTKAFNVYLQAIADVYGASTGYEICRRLCMSNAPSNFSSQKSGGTERLPVSSEINNPHTSPGHSSRRAAALNCNAIVADISTIRIVVQSAKRDVDKKRAAERRRALALARRATRPNEYTQTTPDPETLPPTQQQLWPGSDQAPKLLESSETGYKLDVPFSLLRHQTSQGGAAPKDHVDQVLDYCAAMFLRLGLSEEQLDFEMPGYSGYLRHRGILTWPRSKRARDRFREIQNAPWLRPMSEKPL